jgi:hypothetical protein
MRAPLALALLLTAGGLSVAASATPGSNAAYADGYYAGAPYFDQSACWTDGWAGTFDYPYCGWYNGFFYPGSGAYVYDRNHNRRSLTANEQNHWAARAPSLSNGTQSPGPVRIPGPAAGPGFGAANMRGGSARYGGGGHGFGGVPSFGGGHSSGGPHRGR